MQAAPWMAFEGVCRSIVASPLVLTVMQPRGKAPPSTRRSAPSSLSRFPPVVHTRLAALYDQYLGRGVEVFQAFEPLAPVVGLSTFSLAVLVAPRVDTPNLPSNSRCGE